MYFYVWKKKCKQDRHPNASFIVTVVYNNVSNCVCVCVCVHMCVCVYVSGGEGGRENAHVSVCVCVRVRDRWKDRET